ncbi:hypothetical protein SAMN04490243_1631 [Robiginitalea myxolifaciens]|uniref:Outer membrane protein beta-barrel domain-containing protein n=1 Tax=Robiginitalea myxolifaciens TaxID=400055 RepID=A0A1I6GR76_9FLAO|nr:DUF6048 family protein [Robiginitalea myxolifaciens]SFR44755.1 hypothetical protein SAMN04490243_1631 [Robiginitalea myxolifaciens]
MRHTGAFQIHIGLLFLLLLATPQLSAQEEENLEPVEAATEETRPPRSEAYGLRVGVDLSRILISTLDDKYTGLELVGDYRLKQNLYLAAELGTETREISETLDNENGVNIIELYNFESSGSYLKLGVDYNTYENWFGMNNSIYIGARYAFSTFSKDLNSYTLFNSNRYWNPDSFIDGTQAPQELSGLNASWIEMVAGVKAELFANFFLGASIRLGYLVSRKESDILPHIWIPGFNRVNTESSFGSSFNYTLTYFLPLYRKARAPKPEE